MSPAVLAAACALTLLMLVVRFWPARNDSVKRYHQVVEALGNAVYRSRDSQSAT